MQIIFRKPEQNINIKQAFVFLIILMFFNERMMPHVERPFELIEFFAGDGAISKSARFAYYRVASLDLRFGEIREGKQNPFDLTEPAGLALAVWVLLNARKGSFFTMIAVVCTSFSSMNTGTSKRSPTTPWGDCSRPHVVDPELQD